MLSDLRFAVRQLLKSPAFTATAILSLALGIGANTAIFSLVNDFLLRTLPVRQPEELVLFRQLHGLKGGNLARSEMGNSTKDPVTGQTTGTSFSVLAFERFHANHPALSEVFAFTNLYQSNVLVDGRPDATASAQLVSGDYYKGLGVPATLGRLLTAEDDQPGAPTVAVISDRYWRMRFGHDVAVLNKTILVNKLPVMIVGVSAPGFNGTAQVGETTDISLPLSQYERFTNNEDLTKPWYWWVRIMGRLAPGFTAKQAAASLEPTFQQAAREGWEMGRSMDKTSRPMPESNTLVADPGGQGENDNRRYQRPTLRILMGLVGLVLLAACANVANLLLARGAARRREIAVRLALGASRARLIRQLFTESLLLALLGAAIGTAFAWWGRGLLLALRPVGNAQVLDLPLDGRVLAFTIGVAVVTSLLFGLAPAIRATRLDLSAEFQGGTRALGSGGRSRLSQGLMVVQIALSLVLLVSTALFVGTLRNLQAVATGFNRSQLMMFGIDGGPAGYKQEKNNALKLRILERLEKIPGVRVATFSDIALLNRGRWSSNIGVPGFTPAPGTGTSAYVNPLAPNFFAAMELPLLAGRGFTGRDTIGAPKVAVVNQAFAQRFFSGQNPVGRTFAFGGVSADLKNIIEIVGYAQDAKYTNLRDPIQPTVYLSALQYPDGRANFLVRVAGDVRGFASALRAAVDEIDPALPLLRLRTMEDQLDQNHAQERMLAKLSGFFGLLALALACVGLYGLMSYQVLRRTGEIGLRMALGALPAHVLQMILKESLALICLGVVAGLSGAWYASRLVEKMLFGLSPTDPLTYALTACILIAVALAAALLPARRASRVDPMTALRTE
jgi:predicted permease